MSRERLAYLLFLVVAAAQLAALAVIGDTRFSKGGIVVMVLVAAWLGRGSRVAWWLFLGGNLWLLTAGAGFAFSSGTHTIWGNLVALALGSGMMLAILLSSPMRRWVRPPAGATEHLTAA